MIWSWLKVAFIWLFRLVIPDPYRASRDRRIDPDRPCTACGNHGGRLVFRMIPNTNNHKSQSRPFVIHVCSTCGFKEGFDPVGVPKNPITDFDIEAEYQQVYGNRG